MVSWLDSSSVCAASFVKRMLEHRMAPRGVMTFRLSRVSRLNVQGVLFCFFYVAESIRDS